MSNNWVRLSVCGLIMAAMLIALVEPADAARRRARSRSAGSPAGDSDYAAFRLVDRANDLLKAGESERGVKMLETVLDQYPQSDIRYKVWLLLGKHFLEEHQHLRAINFLRNLRKLDDGDTELEGDKKDMYLESLYLTGVAYFQMRQYGSSFPVLRKITNEYPNTVWANQAYYYIGMCHFAQKNWNKAIEALSVVGTFVDPESPSIQYVEAGRRFYVKVSDQDLPVQFRLGQDVKLKIKATSGDEEEIRCIPLTGESEIFIGSIPTALGPAKPADGTLQVIGGDKISTLYTDSNTHEGKSDVPRESNVQIVSTAAINFTLGDYESKATAAFIGQPVFLTLDDADLDTSNSADSVSVRVTSRYKMQEEFDDNEPTRGIDLEKLFRDDREQWIVRDEMVVSLKELGGGKIVRTGHFGAEVPIAGYRPDLPVDKTDNQLTVALDDEIVATFIDELHITGTSPREISEKVTVVSEIDAKPRATQYVVSDPIVKAKKNLVEAEAYLELAKIFKSMGLLKGTKEKADEGLQRVEPIIRSRQPIPSALTEQGFQLMWELYLVKDDFRNAIQTCQMFNRLYPESPFVDQALMRIGMIKLEKEEYREAIGIFQQILRLTKSQIKAEAQFRIAETTEIMAEKTSRGNKEAAIAQYKKCAEQFPDSEYAGLSISKLVDYYIETRDYAQADDLLDQIFQDYPDAQFLDSMLLKWVMVAYRMRNYQKAYDKCSQLLFEYPSSQFAERAKQILPKIEQRISG